MCCLTFEWMQLLRTAASCFLFLCFASSSLALSCVLLISLVPPVLPRLCFQLHFGVDAGNAGDAVFFVMRACSARATKRVSHIAHG